MLARAPAELLIGPAEARVRAYFAPRAASARAALLDALDSDRYIVLLTGLDQLLGAPLAGPALLPAGDGLPEAVRRARRRARKRARRAGPAPPGPEGETAARETPNHVKDARHATEGARPA